MTPLYRKGFIYGIDGETEQIAQLVCVDASSGAEKWREQLTWEDAELTGKSGRPQNIGFMRGTLLQVDGKTLCLGETGTLLWLDLSPSGVKVEARTQLFYALNTWCVPAVSRGLLYVMQNERERVRSPETGTRILCYDMRAP
jgi:hypothetical protein